MELLLAPFSVCDTESDGEAVVPGKVCGEKALCSANVLFVGVIVFVDLGFRDSQCFFIVIHMTIIVTWPTQTWWLLSV